MRNNILRQDLEPATDSLRSEEPKLTSGPNVSKFENQWSSWLGCKYSVFVNSGSSANLLCLALLKELYPKGGKVIVPPFTWSSDISSLIWIFGFICCLWSISYSADLINDWQGINWDIGNI